MADATATTPTPTTGTTAAPPTAAPTSPSLMVSATPAQGQYNAAVGSMQKAQANTTPTNYAPTPVDTNLYAKPGEDYASYTARVSAYQASKNTAPTAAQNTQVTDTPTKTPPPAESSSTTPAPADSTSTSTTTTTPSTSSGVNTTGLDPTLSSAYNASIDAMSQQVNDVQSTIASAKATAANDPALQAALDQISTKYNALITDAQNKNRIVLGNANTSMAAFGGLGPMSQTFLSSQVTAADKRVSDLQAEADNLKLQTKVAYDQKDAAAVTTLQTEYDKLNVDKTNAIKDLLAAVSKQQQDAKTQAAADAKVKYDTVTKPIQDLAAEASKNGASPDIISKITGATTMEQAIQLAGDSIHTSTNPDIAQYLFYKQQATQAGTTPQSFTTWKDAQDAHALALKTKEAYATSYASASGKAAADAANTPATDTPSPIGLGGDAKGGSILAQTGLSIGAFNFITQGTQSMSRMPAKQRNQIMAEAQNYLNKNGVDISTFQSQYKAYNDVLTKNIARANNTKIMADEVSGTADSLIQTIKGDAAANDPLASIHGGGGMTSVRAANIVALMTGAQFNNKFVQTYSTQIQLMANDLAGYMAAARGAQSPELQDMNDAANIIANGMNTGSVEALQKTINSNEQKVGAVVNKAVDTSRKGVWGLFGVGDKFAPGTNSASDQLVQQGQQAKAKVDSYITAHPDQADKISNLYQTPSAAFGGQTPNDEQIAEYLNL